MINYLTPPESCNQEYIHRNKYLWEIQKQKTSAVLIGKNVTLNIHNYNLTQLHKILSKPCCQITFLIFRYHHGKRMHCLGCSPCKCWLPAWKISNSWILCNQLYIAFSCYKSTDNVMGMLLFSMLSNAISLI